MNLAAILLHYINTDVYLQSQQHLPAMDLAFCVKCPRLRYFSRRQQWELPLQGTAQEQRALVEMVLAEYMHQQRYERRTMLYTLNLTNLAGYDDDCNRIAAGAQPQQPASVAIKQEPRDP